MLFARTTLLVRAPSIMMTYELALSVLFYTYVSPIHPLQDYMGLSYEVIHTYIYMLYAKS